MALGASPRPRDPGRQPALQLAAIGEPSDGATKPTCTEAAVYSQLGIDTIVFGPGVSEGNVHRPNEQNSLRQCEKAITFYTRMIERFCVR